MITECCICQDYKNKETNRWYTPQVDERRDNYMQEKRISHTYCPPCFILNLKREGYKESEIKEMVDEIL
jgi:hypothetical protein